MYKKTMMEVIGYAEKNTRIRSLTDSTGKLINNAVNTAIPYLWDRCTDQCELSMFNSITIWSATLDYVRILFVVHSRTLHFPRRDLSEGTNCAFYVVTILHTSWYYCQILKPKRNLYNKHELFESFVIHSSIYIIIFNIDSKGNTNIILNR